MTALKPKLPSTRCDCGSHYCYYCRSLAATKAYDARKAAKRVAEAKPRILSMGSRARKMRAWRSKREKIGRDAYWMIGYDGPSPYPASPWPRIIEHARLYGLET